MSDHLGATLGGTLTLHKTFIAVTEVFSQQVAPVNDRCTVWLSTHTTLKQSDRFTWTAWLEVSCSSLICLLSLSNLTGEQKHSNTSVWVPSGTDHKQNNPKDLYPYSLWTHLLHSLFTLYIYLGWMILFVLGSSHCSLGFTEPLGKLAI